MKENTRNDLDGIGTKELQEAVGQMIQALGQSAREYKDRVFRMLFKEKANALELYNALNNTFYDDPDELIVTTLENALYMGMKNDVSYVLASQLMMYEHQSTWNPNIPLRDLFYVSCMLAVLTCNANLYGSKQIRIPEPQFLVFYNGRTEMEDVTTVRLSDAYEVRRGTPMLELVVKVLNINKGHNEQLAKKCPVLYQYMQFIDRIRTNQKYMDFPDAVETAVDDCIRDGILTDFLMKNRAEVLHMTIFEYDQEKHLQQEREEAEERGVSRGREQQAQDMALELYKNGVPIETIAKAARVSEDVVRQWMKSNLFCE